MDAEAAARALGGAALLGFLPGWAWARYLLPEQRLLERVTTAVALSIALMALFLFVGSAVLSIPVTAAHAIWWALAISLAGAAAAMVDSRRRR